MKIRRVKKQDMEDIMKITKMSQEYFKDQEIPQWMGDYPNENVYLEDMANNSLYLVEEDGIVGFMAAIIGPEPSYSKIYSGSWLNENKGYMTLHRVAVDKSCKGRGIGGRMFEFAESLAKDKNLKSMRIDTHRKNKSMLSLIEKNGYKYCGVVYMTDGGERLAYEKMLED